MNYELEVTVLILNKNRAEETLSVIKFLDKNHEGNINFVIIDDNSDDYSTLKNLKNEKTILYTYPIKNEFGLIKKYNFGFVKTLKFKPKYIFVVQNDMKINDENLLDELKLYLDNNVRCAVVGPTIFNGKGIKTWGGIDKYRMGHKINTSEAFLMRTSCLIEYGLWNESLGYFYEDIEYFIRLNKGGYYTHSVKHVSLIHYGGGTSSVYVNQKDYYRVRASIMFLKKFNKDYSVLENIKFFNEEISYQKNRAKKYIINLDYISLFRLLYFMLLGLLSGFTNNLEDLESSYKNEMIKQKN